MLEEVDGEKMSQSDNQPPPVDPRFVHLLTRWDNEVRSLEKQGWEAQRTAQEFAKLGLSSALLLNGGALLALPPLMQWLSLQGREQVAHSALWFLIGAIATAVAIVIAYINWMIIKDEQYTQATKRARELDCSYVNKDVKTDAIHSQAIRKLGRFPFLIDGTAIVALVFAIGAYLFFGVGVYKFINLAEHNTIAPVIDTGKSSPVPIKSKLVPSTPLDQSAEPKSAPIPAPKDNR